MTGPAMVQLASSDFWKVPYDFLVAWEQELAASSQHILLEYRLALLQKKFSLYTLVILCCSFKLAKKDMSIS